MKTTNANANANTIAIGTAVFVQDKYGRDFGIIDEITDFGLGFVSSTKDGWIGRLVSEEAIEVLESKSDVSKAIQSAVGYFKLEKQSLVNRLARKLKADESAFIQDKIQSMIEHCDKWLGILSCKNQNNEIK